MMRFALPTGNPTPPPARPRPRGSAFRAAADLTAGPRTAFSPFERVLAALAYRETGAPFLPDAETRCAHPFDCRCGFAGCREHIG